LLKINRLPSIGNRDAVASVVVHELSSLAVAGVRVQARPRRRRQIYGEEVRFTATRYQVRP
jgi:hypothetical protein